MLRRRFRHDAVAQIEDKRIRPQRLADRVDPRIESGAARNQQQGIEIALHHCPARQTFSYLIQRHGCVATDPVNSSRLNERI